MAAVPQAGGQRCRGGCGAADALKGGVLGRDVPARAAPRQGGETAFRSLVRQSASRHTAALKSPKQWAPRTLLVPRTFGGE